ncbi:hypothetical protein HZB01_03665 [Candidatus Woesearchaeota archaeon]|nr:hypothetical protein [Candidatus Woesearchaeota archaeon]
MDRNTGKFYLTDVNDVAGLYLFNTLYTGGKHNFKAAAGIAGQKIAEALLTHGY